MSESSKLLIVHRKSTSEAVLDIRVDNTDGSPCDKGQRTVSTASRKAVFATIGFALLLIIMGANFSMIQSSNQKPLRKESSASPNLVDEPVQIRSRSEAQKLQARIDTLQAEFQLANEGKHSGGRSAVSSGQKIELLDDLHALKQPVQASSSITMLSQPSEPEPGTNVHAHLLAFVQTLNAAGRNMRSDCDDPDFKDADLINSFLSKKVDICTPSSAAQQSDASKISSSHIVCYQHQQARHTATDSICEGRNVALHLPSFEGYGMSAFVEATWMNMKPGALQAACTPTGPFSKDKFPLCLGDWFVSGFRQVTLQPLSAPSCPLHASRRCTGARRLM
jgi:hypothetical protein